MRTHWRANAYALHTHSPIACIAHALHMHSPFCHPFSTPLHCTTTAHSMRTHSLANAYALHTHSPIPRNAHALHVHSPFFTGARTPPTGTRPRASTPRCPTPPPPRPPGRSAVRGTRPRWSARRCSTRSSPPRALPRTESRVSMGMRKPMVMQQNVPCVGCMVVTAFVIFVV